jgi:hypothetical protein
MARDHPSTPLVLHPKTTRHLPAEPLIMQLHPRVLMNMFEHFNLVIPSQFLVSSSGI